MAEAFITQAVFKGNYIIKGKIECLTGLHIGGSKEKLEIGGVDSPVLRHPHTRLPYIPGSSLKGKMRHLLEFATGEITNPVDGKLGNVSRGEAIVRLFGLGADDKPRESGPTRLIVRDAHPDNVTIKMWSSMDSELLYTEYKPENSIDRLTAAANPRFIERVVKDSCFDFEIIYGVYEIGHPGDDFEKEIQTDLDNLLATLRLLENSAIGKSGSRGYGQIQFHFASPIFVTVEDYQKGTDNYVTSNSKISTDKSNLNRLTNITLKYKAN